MNLKEQNILFLTRAMHIGGTEKVILQLCEIFQPLVRSVVVCSYGGESVKALKKMGIKHYSIPDMQKRNISTIVRVLKTIKKVVRKEEITVIHTHCRMAAFYIQLLGLYKHCFFVNTSHTVFFNKKILNKVAYKNAHCIACGEMVKKNLEEFYSVEGVKVIHNAIKPFNEELKEDSFLADLKSKGCFLIGNISRLSEEKGVMYFIKAVPKVLERNSHVKFIVVGIGPEEEQLKDLCKTMSIEEDVFFLGYRSDIQNIMSQLDLIVLSSLMEGLPLTPIEAFSVGKSIIATAVGGTIEIVRDGIEGILVEPRNPDAIAEKMNYVIDHPDVKVCLENNAKQRFINKFSFEKFKEEYVNFYQGL